MILLSTIYENINKLKKLLDKSNINKNDKCLISIYTTNIDKKGAIALAKDIKKILPNADITGASTSSIIFKGKQFSDKTLIMMEQFEKAEVFTKIHNWKEIPVDKLAKDIVFTLEGKAPKLLRTLFGGYYNKAKQFIEEINKININRKEPIKLVGGNAGEINGFEDNIPFVFNENEATNYGISIIYICGKNIKAYTGVNTAYESITETYTLTDADESQWKTIDDIDAMDWICKYLGINKIPKTKEWDEKNWEEIAKNDPLSKFRIIIEGSNYENRYLKIDLEKNILSQYITETPVGTKFRIGYTSPFKCVEACYNICDEIRTKPIENLFCYSCDFRKIFMNNCAEWELTPFVEYNICGIFLLGEIAYTDDKNEFLNGACVLSGIAEKERYIIPNTDVFQNLYGMEDENKELLEFLLKNQKEKNSQANKELLEKVINQQKYFNEKFKIDPIFGMGNLIKYKEDKKEYKFDKLFMIQVENADLLMKYMGQDKYFEHIKTQIEEIINFLEKEENAKDLYPYILNNSTIIFAGGQEITEEHFIYISRKIHKNFRVVKTKEYKVPIINRFILVINQKDMIETAFNTLRATQKSQEHFIICDKELYKKVSSTEELEMITLINMALEEDNIVPYYQGIYDNKLKCITKYEALMRIITTNGKIYYPNDFLEISKKYHMYERLSKHMIERVFADFENRNSSVSINLSFIDIENDNFTKAIYKIIKKAKNPQNFIFEILEEEEFENFSKLNDFIAQVKKYNIKIAIDDFGTGYSNLLEITKIKPDFLKIDGAIIKDINNKEENQIILKTICYLAKQLELEMIAEFVENQEVQKYIETLDIEYSQGYFFAKPLPLKEL